VKKTGRGRPEPPRSLTLRSLF